MRLTDFVESLRQTIESAGIDGGVTSSGNFPHDDDEDEDETDDEINMDGVNTFEDEGLMTRNKGLVVHMSNGDEFQITIVKSR
jgi:hypothetical protein